MRAAAVVLTLLVTVPLASTVQGAASGGPPLSLSIALVDAPAWVALSDAEPVPFALGLLLQGEPGEAVTLRAGLASGSAWASKTWTRPLNDTSGENWSGGTWQRSDWRLREPILLNASGGWRGHLAVLPNLEATHAAAVLGGNATTLRIDVTPSRGAPVQESVPIALRRDVTTGRFDAGNATLATILTPAGPSLLPVLSSAASLTPFPAPVSGAFSLLVAAQPVALPPADGLAVRTKGAAGWELRNLADGPRLLAGVCLVGSRSRGCFAEGSLAGGEAVLIGREGRGAFAWTRAPAASESLRVLDTRGREMLPPPPVEILPFETAGATAYVTPKGSLSLLLDLFRSAGSRIDVAGYTFDSSPLAHALAEAATRGVRVRVLVEGSPVGGVTEAEQRALGFLAASGVDVRVLPASGSPFPAFHPKYAIVDNGTLLVASENWGRNAYPSAGDEGNRGWGIVLANRTAVASFRRLFQEDYWLGESLRPRASVLPVESTSREPPTMTVVAGSIPVSVVLSPYSGPGDAHPLVGLMANASESIDAALLSLSPNWRDGPSPLFDGLLEAARRGVRVRVLLAVQPPEEGSTWNGNEAAHAMLMETAARENLDLEARFLSRTDIKTLHAKGLLVDGRIAVVGSLNWVEPAVRRNREVDVIVESPEVAAFFSGVFETDWNPPAAAQAPPPRFPPAIVAVALLASAAQARLWLGRGERGARNLE